MNTARPICPSVLARDRSLERARTGDNPAASWMCLNLFSVTLFPVAGRQVAPVVSGLKQVVLASPR